MMPDLETLHENVRIAYKAAMASGDLEDAAKLRKAREALWAAKRRAQAFKLARRFPKDRKNAR